MPKKGTKEAKTAKPLRQARVRKPSKEKDEADDPMMMKKLAIGIIILIVSAFLIKSCVQARELPLLVEIPELNQEHNNKRVVVFGWVRSVELKRGRMGSKFLELIVGEGDGEISVLSIYPVFSMVNAKAIVQGRYFDHGRFGGIPQDSSFIVADEIMRDWQGDLE